MYGGDDGARTRDLCRDSEKEGRNLQKTSVTDGFFWRCKERSGTVIEPISNPRPLPCRPLPFRLCQQLRGVHQSVHQQRELGSVARNQARIVDK
jgi:hypothetical protein